MTLPCNPLLASCHFYSLVVNIPFSVISVISIESASLVQWLPDGHWQEAPVVLQYIRAIG